MQHLVSVSNEIILQNSCQQADFKHHNQKNSNTISTVATPVLAEVANISSEDCDFKSQKNLFEKKSLEKLVLLHLLSILKN